MSNLYKRALIRRILHVVDSNEISFSPTRKFICLCKKYNILDLVLNAVTSGEYMSLGEWKKEVKHVIQSWEIKRWKVTCCLYRSLSYLHKDIVQFTVCPWWHHAYVNIEYYFKCRFIVQVLIGRSRRMSGLCKQCNCSQVSIEHILFDCNVNSEARDIKWAKVEEGGVPALISDLNAMSIENYNYL